MTSKPSLERLSGALEHAWSHFYHQQETAPSTRDFTIALSREAGVPDAAIAHEVGRRLGWPVYDHELLEQIAEDMHLRASVLREVDERPVPWLVERMQTFLAQPAVTEPGYVEHLIRTLLSLAAHGRCVVVGRGSPHLLPAATTLRVRLMAPRDDRIASLARQERLTPARAEERLATIERERAAFTRRHFQADPAEAEHYDLLLNCSRFDVNACAELIIAALHRLEFQSAEAVGEKQLQGQG